MTSTTPSSATEDAELLPCPFCGIGGATIDGQSLYSVRCTSCQSRTGYYAEESGAIRAWNRRSRASSQPQPTARLVDRELAAKRAESVENPLGNPTHGYHCGFLSGRQEAAKAVRAIASTPSPQPGEVAANPTCKRDLQVATPALDTEELREILPFDFEPSDGETGPATISDSTGDIICILNTEGISAEREMRDEDVVRQRENAMKFLAAMSRVRSPRQDVQSSEIARARKCWTDEMRGKCALRCGEFGEPPCWEIAAWATPCLDCSPSQKATDVNAGLLAALKCARGHIHHMGAWITKQDKGYSFESIGEDLPGISEAISNAERAAAESASGKVAG